MVHSLVIDQSLVIDGAKHSETFCYSNDYTMPNRTKAYANTTTHGNQRHTTELEARSGSKLHNMCVMEQVDICKYVRLYHTTYVIMCVCICVSVHTCLPGNFTRIATVVRVTLSLAVRALVLCLAHTIRCGDNRRRRRIHRKMFDVCVCSCVLACSYVGSCVRV